MEFSKWLDNNWQKDNMFPPPLNPQEALNFLQEYLLGKDWYIVNPLTTAQANCEVVHDILYKYSKKFRKEVNRRRKSKWKSMKKQE